SVWHDKWSDNPSIDSIMSRRDIYSAGFSNDETVYGCVSGNQWTWPSYWFEKYPILLSFPVPKINDSNEDRLVWRTNEGFLKPFSTNQAWKDIRILNRIVQWWKVIWFSQNIPSYAFVSWMAMKNKLVTHDKLAVWYPGSVWNCSLCKKISDSHEHLFFECELSKEVWNNVLTMIQLKDLKDLDSCKNQLPKLPVTNNIWSIVRRLAFASTIYFIWKERNLKTFQQKSRSPEVLCQTIIDCVKCKLLSLKVKNSKAVMFVERIWKHLNSSIIADLKLKFLVSWSSLGVTVPICDFISRLALGGIWKNVLVTLGVMPSPLFSNASSVGFLQFDIRVVRDMGQYHPRYPALSETLAVL
ncbi:RNA-directed DNA polymerase, eukaryota, reverse transcriptase zinc-binding domain protein, partial [Tanacetum coccineum]